MTARPTLLLALLVSAAALAGCTSGSSSDSSAASGAARSSTVAGPAAPAAGTAAAQPEALGLGLGRDVVRTASQTVQVDDVRAAAERARAAAESAGGGLEAEDSTEGQDVLRLRVAPDRLTEQLDGYARLGRERSRTVGSSDVTEQVADLDSRLATQRASVERVRALLSGAQALTDVVTIEGQLAQREGDLESLQARERALRASVDLATVTLTLVVTPPASPAAAEAADFGSGLSAGLDALRAAARAGSVLAGALLPFLPLLALALWAARRYLRRGAPGPVA